MSGYCGTAVIIWFHSARLVLKSICLKTRFYMSSYGHIAVGLTTIVYKPDIFYRKTNRPRNNLSMA